MNQRGHDAYSRNLLPYFSTAITVTSVVLGASPANVVGYTATCAAAYWAGCFYLGPDLDMTNTSPTKRWGWFKFIWLPYAQLRKHRGVSHLPIYGSLERIAYLSSIFSAMCLVAALSGHVVPLGLLATVGLDYWLCIYAGIEAGCLLHLYCDFVAKK